MTTRYFAAALLALVVWAWRCPGAEIWDRPILAEPFEKAPLRRVHIPEWVQETTGVGYTLSGMNTQQRERAVAVGVTISELGFVDPFYAYYDSKLLKRRSPHVPLERINKEVAEYKRLGIRILGVYPPSLQGEVYENHPDWRRIATNTAEIPQVDLKKYPHGGMLCLLGPYGDFFIDVLAEILTEFPDVDAFSFDGLHYGGVCYCQHCREAFRKEMGTEIPNVNMDDPAFRRYQHWADRRMEDLIRRMQERLKGIKPEVALVTWTTNAGRFGHFRDIPRNMPARMNMLLDAPDQELWLDETNRGSTIVPAFGCAYAWAVSGHRVAFSEPYLMSHGNPYGKDSFPPHEIERRMMLAITHGVSPSIAVGQPEHLQQAVYDCLGEVKKRKAWLTHKRPEPWGALLVSDNTRNFYGRSSGKVEERYMANVFGVFRAAMEEHLPVTLINDWDVNDEDLAPYKVLILANSACLSDAQAAALRRFVERGGGLVASLDTSAFDEFGDARKDFALADVFGVSHRGEPKIGPATRGSLDVNFARAVGPDYWEKRKGVFDFRWEPDTVLDSPKIRRYLGVNSPVTFKGQAVAVAYPAADTKMIGTIQTRDDGAGATLNAVVTRSFGKGRVIYLAAGFDSAYYLYSYPYERLILKQGIEWAANSVPPVRVVAPMCVQATVMRQERDGRRLIVHLFNDLNTTGNHAMPNDDVPLREEAVPVRGIRVTFSAAFKLGRVHLEPGGEGLAVKESADGPYVTVPELLVHGMVVAELGE